MMYCKKKKIRWNGENRLRIYHCGKGYQFSLRKLVVDPCPVFDTQTMSEKLDLTATKIFHMMFVLGPRFKYLLNWDFEMVGLIVWKLFFLTRCSKQCFTKMSFLETFKVELCPIHVCVKKINDGIFTILLKNFVKR